MVQYFGFPEEGQCNFGMGEHFHHRLREERVRLTPKQADFAAKLGVRQSQLSEWEKGGVGLKAEQLALLATAGVDILYVVTGRRGGELLPDRESVLLQFFRLLDLEDQDMILSLTLRLSGRSTTDQRMQFYHPGLPVGLHERQSDFKGEQD